MLLISVYGYLHFRESRSYDQQVAKDASVVYKLNVDGLLKTIAVDFISNPGYYLKTNEKGGPKPDFSLSANVFVYSLKTKAPGTFFSGLALSDTTGLNAWLKRVLKITDFAVQGAGKSVGTSSDRKITVLYDGKTFAIAYSFKREEVLVELNDILDKKNRMEAGTPLMIALKKAKGHLSWTTAANSGRLNFKDGLAEVDGSFPTEGLDIPDQPRSMVEFADHALIKIRVNAGLKTSGLPEALSLKGISLQTDTLLKSYLGFAALEMGPAITQMDSLIAYEYNDDFEKVATVQLKKVTVPKLKLSIEARTPGLLAYLKENQVISTEDRLNKELFPLYQVFSTTKNNIWQLSTLENDPVNETEAIRNTSNAKPDFFALTADLRGIKAQQVFPLLNNWLRPFSHLKITAAKIDSGTARLNGTLEFEEKNINAFIQMIQ